MRRLWQKINVENLAARVKRFAKKYNAQVNAEAIKPCNANALLLLQECLCVAVESLTAVLKH